MLSPDPSSVSRMEKQSWWRLSSCGGWFLYVLLLIVHTAAVPRSAAAAAGVFATRLYGVNYSLRIGPDWAPDSARCKSRSAARTDLVQLQSQITNNVRIFSVTDCDAAATLLSLTQELHMKIWLGLWVGPNQLNFDSERARLSELLNTTDFGNVLGIHVSSEAIYRHDITVAQAIAMRNLIKSDLDKVGLKNIPVTVADVIDTYLYNANLVQVDPLAITFNQFPFWEHASNTAIAAQNMADKVRQLENQAGGRQIIVTETGWADAGFNAKAGVADPANMAQWMRDFVCLANERKWQYFWFIAYDSDWERANDQLPNDVEGHFGIYYHNGTMKPYIQDLVFNCASTTAAPTLPPASIQQSKKPSPSPISHPPVTSQPSAAPIPPPVAIRTPSAMPIQPPVATQKPTDSPVHRPVATNKPTDSPVQRPVATNKPTASPVQRPVATNKPTASPVQRPVATNKPSVSPIQRPPVATNKPSVAHINATPSVSPTTSPLLLTVPSASPIHSPVSETNKTSTSLASPTSKKPSHSPSTPVSNRIPSVTTPSNMPFFSTSPSSSTKNNNSLITASTECQFHSACAALNLTGQCCPLQQNMSLTCCGGVVQETCALNGACLALELQGACCPTIDDKYLDCCAVIPSDCQTKVGSCKIYSAVQYKLDQAKQTATSGATWPTNGVVWRLHTTLVTLLLMMCGMTV